MTAQRPYSWCIGVLAGLLALFAASFAVADDEISTLGPPAVTVDGFVREVKDALGVNLLFNIRPTREELAIFGTALDPLLAAYMDRDVFALREGLINLRMAYPEAASSEIVLLLDAEAYYMASKDDLALRVRMAKPIYRDLLHLYPKTARTNLARFRYGSILFQQGYDPEAAGQFAFLIEDDRGDMRNKASLFLGETLTRLEDLDGAKESFETVWNGKKANKAERAAAGAGLAVVATLRDDNEAAREYFDQVIESPEDWTNLDETALSALAQLHRQAGENDEARQVLEKIIETYPKSVERSHYGYRLADILRETGHNDDAARVYRLIIEQDGHGEWGLAARVRLGDMLAAEHPTQWNEEAAKLYREVIADPLYADESIDAQWSLARMEVATGRLREALDELANMLARPAKPEIKMDGLKLIGGAYADLAEDLYANRDFGQIARLFSLYTPYLFTQELNETTFDRVVEAYEQSLLFDSLLTIAVSEAAQRFYPHRAELARAHALAARGETDKARVICRYLMKNDDGYVARRAALQLVRMAAAEDNPILVIESSNDALSLPHDALDRAELMVLRSTAKLR
ncbi:tetratricopeptide repeat protein, partial [bacterium]|nr:tetratricopeptide repeat protein [bacterium]